LALCALLLPFFCSSPLLPGVFADGNEAEKLFRDMEKKITQARAFRVAVTIETGRDTNRPGDFNGYLLLTKDNKARLKIEEDDFGDSRRWEFVSNGKQLRMRPYTFGVSETSKDEATLPTPKFLHDHLAERVTRVGIFPNLLRIAVPILLANERDTKLELTDFQACPDEKIRGRDARVVRYKVSIDDKVLSDFAFTLWVDRETGLPLQRVLQAKPVGTVTEIYTEFNLNPKISRRTFVLPKPLVPLDENIAIDKLPVSAVQSAKKRFPNTRLRSAVLARPGSEWLRPDQKQPLYLLDLANGHLHIALWVTREGEITEIINEIPLAKLPKEAKEYVDKHYPGQSGVEVNELYEVRQGKETLVAVKVFLSPAIDGTRVLVFSPKRKFLRKEE
jgi:outer membrane lipoprotein-sorting protein